MLNKIIITGRLIKDPEKRTTTSNKSATNFCLAVERDFIPQGTTERETDFINFVAFGGAADHICKYFSKGRLMTVVGRLQIRKWTDKEGHERSSAEVMVESTYFADSKRSDDTDKKSYDEAPTPAEYKTSEPAEEMDENDLPF